MQTNYRTVRGHDLLLYTVFKRDGPLASVPGAHREAVLTVASRLDSLLTAPDLFLIPATRYHSPPPPPSPFPNNITQEGQMGL